MDNILLFLLSLPMAAPKGSHSLWMLATYIKGQTPFPEFSYVGIVDDVTVLYYNGETKTLIPRGNTTTEDDMFDLKALVRISDNIQSSFTEKLVVATKNLNKTYSVIALQRLVVCELRDDGEPGQMITRDAVSGSTTDELLYVDKNFTYQGNLDVSTQVLNIHLKISKWNHEYLYQPFCIKTLKGYLEKRRNQINRKVKPKVRLLQKELSSGSRVSCLATGFYPRHINLTLFRDGQPVSDHEITGGDLVPNGDGTYQMRKSLEISADKHKYSCSATHLSLDNKLHVTLEYDHEEPFISVFPSVLTVLALMMVFGVAAAVIAWKRQCTGRSSIAGLPVNKQPVETDTEVSLTDLRIKIYALNIQDMAIILILLALSAPAVTSKGSHSLCLHSTYIKGKTLFPEFSSTLMLDDIVVGQLNSETWTYVPRGNTTNEDDVIDPQNIRIISKYMYDDFEERWIVLDGGNLTDSLKVQQKMVLCELLDNDKPGQMITRSSSKGFTTDEMSYLDGNFTYNGASYITQQELKPRLELSMWRHEHLYYPACIKTLKKYQKKKTKSIKPRVKLIQKANSDSGESRVSCLATGFYPRHINLTLFRDGQPVSDHEITGGDLLPNGDGTYQMRKSLEISADKHKYSCSATHLSLDNKLHVTLEFDPGEPFKSVIPSVLTVLALLLVFGTGAVIYKYRRRRAASSKSDYSAASRSEESVEKPPMHKPQQEVTEISETSLNN
ncbi:unnamed protein product [Leuciscus chuanchicus]